MKKRLSIIFQATVGIADFFLGIIFILFIVKIKIIPPNSCNLTLTITVMLLGLINIFVFI